MLALRPVYVSSFDPVLGNSTLAGFLWIDTSGATPVFKLRNITDSGWDTIGGGGTQMLQKVEVTLTDAQIKALPNTPVEIVSPTQVLNYVGVPSTLPAPIFAVLVLNTTAGAYTNVDGAAQLSIGWGSDWSADPMTRVAGPGQLTVAKVSLSKLISQSSVVETATPGNVTSVLGTFINLDGNLQDNGLFVVSGNAAAGAFTGGNANNTLKVTVFYTIVDL